METFNSIEKNSQNVVEKNLEVSNEFKEIKRQIEDVKNIEDKDVLKNLEIFMMNGEHEEEETDMAVDLLVKYRKEASEILLGELHIA